jgi:hypothetical protein
MQKDAKKGGKPKDTSGHRTNTARKLPGRAPERIKQDFFPRSASATATKTQGYLFNQAPIDRNQVREEAKEKASKAPKRSAFVAKLYNEEEDDVPRRGTIDDEMKVFDMSSSDEGEGTSRKRDAKTAEKKNIKPAKKGRSESLPA